jgi:uncharacterized membrane protein YecN with MAPEG domain
MRRDTDRDLCMGNTIDWAALLTLATLLLLFGCASYVGWARGKYRVNAPSTTGPEGFERAFRVQMNTLENAAIFLPVLWLATLYANPAWVAVLGALWLVARVWYAVAYASDPKTRGAAFVTAYAAWGALMFLAAWGVLGSLLR